MPDINEVRDVKLPDAANTDQGGEEKVEDKVEKPEAEQEVKEPDYNALEPEVRKRPIDYIEERRARRSESSSDVKGFEESEEELSPKAKDYLDKEIEKRFNPLQKTLMDQENDREVTDFLSRPGNDQYRKYESLARKYMKVWENTPAKAIFKYLDSEYGNPAERGAGEERERQKQAARAKGGTSYRPSNVKRELSAEDIAKLSPDQFKGLQSRISQGESVKTE